MNVLEKCAEILVEQGYAEFLTGSAGVIIVKYGEMQLYPESVDPFYSRGHTHMECLARRQADAIEDWLECNEPVLWVNSRVEVLMINYKTRHSWRLARVKWCIERLVK